MPSPSNVKAEFLGFQRIATEGTRKVLRLAIVIDKDSRGEDPRTKPLVAKNADPSSEFGLMSGEQFGVFKQPRIDQLL
jgi:hypothetical protein